METIQVISLPSGRAANLAVGVIKNAIPPIKVPIEPPGFRAGQRDDGREIRQMHEDLANLDEAEVLAKAASLAEKLRLAKPKKFYALALPEGVACARSALHGVGARVVEVSDRGRQLGRLDVLYS